MVRLYCSESQSLSDIASRFNLMFTLGFIYIRAKATSLLTCCIVSDLCSYTTATAVAANIKEKNRFRVRLRSNINEPLISDKEQRRESLLRSLSYSVNET